MAIGDLKTRLRARFTRHNSISSSLASNDGDYAANDNKAKSVKSTRSHGSHITASVFSRITKLGDNKAEVVDEEGPDLALPGVQESSAVELEQDGNDLQQLQAPTSTSHLLDVNDPNRKHYSSSTTFGFSTPNTDTEFAGDYTHEEGGEENTAATGNGDLDVQVENATSSKRALPSRKPPDLTRRQSLLPHQQTTLIKTLLETEIPPPSRAANLDYFTSNGPSTISPNMVSRKIWVRRPGTSATRVTINEDDLVDDVREMILRKYANSLGSVFDAPDVTLRLIPREPRQERILGPEEEMSRTLDAFYPGGQAVSEALVIDVPLRRTPKPSPRGGPPVTYVYADEIRPGETGSDYFPPMPVPVIPSPQLPNSVPVTVIHRGANGSDAVSVAGSHHSSSTSHAMSVLTTGHVPNLPSPGGSRRHYPRPRATRHNTSSPTVNQGHIQTPTAANNGTITQVRGTRSRTHSSASEKSTAPPAPPLPTPPADNSLGSSTIRASTPPPRVSSPRPTTRTKKSKKNDHPSLPAGLLNGAVPPINVLIVEDNIINLKLLEAFMKRLKVRWQTAMNGKEAVTKWRAGGFHLVLMDIQLPVMNGLQATREIRRLEKLNSIGVFSSSASSSAPEKASDEPEGEDKLPSSVLFKSPVIIVALTASSLQSDRHEALAAGCNDFLTKVGMPLFSVLIRTVLTSTACEFRLVRT
jgi:osomolarity two-component system response regulator SSK1